MKAGSLVWCVLAVAVGKKEDLTLARLHGRRAVALMVKGCVPLFEAHAGATTTPALGCVAQRYADWLASLRGALLFEVAVGAALEGNGTTDLSATARAAATDGDRDAAIDALSACDERGAAPVFSAAGNAAPEELEAAPWVRCVARNAEGHVAFAIEETAAARAINADLADAWSTEACAARAPPWTPAAAPGAARVRTLLNGTAGAAVLVDGFLTGGECDALVAASRGRLAPATVFDASKGGEVRSDARRASVAAPLEGAGAELAERVAERARSAAVGLLGLPARLAYGGGQEPMSIVRYGPGDAYPAHCDGSCDGTPHMSGGRVASAVLYCGQPDDGSGATLLVGAGQIVHPRRGQALFLSYRAGDADSPSLHLSDGGTTRHAGCPVVKGEKWIGTVFVRDGVDEWWRPWWAFETAGGWRDWG